MRRKCSGSPTTCSSATGFRPARYAHPTESASIFGISLRRSSCSAHGVTISRRRSRRWIGFSISTTTSEEIVENGQTIVYTMHQSIGHLGIFVSGKVATKEHGEFVSCMEMIDLLPPGLYEAVITEVDANTVNPDLVHGKYLFRLEARTLNHLRALGGNDAEDDKRFATVARVSEINRGVYETFVAPAVRMAVTEQTAEASRAMHPNRLRFAMFSDRNPLMQPVKAMAEVVRTARQPVSADNPFLAMERATSSWITTCLQSFGELRDAMTEAVFLNTYGSPLATGIGWAWYAGNRAP